MYPILFPFFIYSNNSGPEKCEHGNLGECDKCDAIRHEKEKVTETHAREAGKTFALLFKVFAVGVFIWVLINLK
jgi:hypothetical protein